MTPPQYKILIIDDSASDRKIYRRFLKSQKLYDFDVWEAATVKTGVDICRSLSPDCVILDYHLPDQDGLSAMNEIRAAVKAPIVFITGKPEALVMTEAYRRGVAKYISKDTVTSTSLQEAVYDAMELPY